MRVRVKGLGPSVRLQAFVVDRMQTALQHAQGQTATATVTFTDVNGPKRGVDIRCALVVALPGRGILRISELATTHELAFDQGFTILMRRLAERQSRSRVLARRPKKYYLAKRLLVTELSTAPSEKVGARTRPARRRATVGGPL